MVEEILSDDDDDDEDLSIGFNEEILNATDFKNQKLQNAALKNLRVLQAELYSAALVVSTALTAHNIDHPSFIQQCVRSMETNNENG
jgi:hypothetical protein